MTEVIAAFALALSGWMLMLRAPVSASVIALGAVVSVVAGHLGPLLIAASVVALTLWVWGMTEVEET